MNKRIAILIILSILMHCAVYFGRIIDPVEWEVQSVHGAAQEHANHGNDAWNELNASDPEPGAILGTVRGNALTTKIGTIPSGKISSSDHVFRARMDLFTVIWLVSLLFHLGTFLLVGKR